MPSPVIFQARRLASAPFPGDTQPWLSGINFSLSRGQVLHALGRSGSGKATLLRLRNRLQDASAGALELAGENALAMPPLDFRHRVQLVLQTPVAFDGKLLDNICLSPPSRPAVDKERARDAAGTLGLDVDVLDRRADTVSVGELYRGGIVRALLAAPEVLLLDEPTAALDPASSAQVYAALQRFLDDDGAIVCATHDSATASALGGNALFIHDGTAKNMDTPDALIRLGEQGN